MSDDWKIRYNGSPWQQVLYLERLATDLQAQNKALRELFEGWMASGDVVAMSYAAQAKLVLQEQGE